MSNVISLSPADDLQAAVDAAPEYATLCLAPGEYRCKTVIRTRGLTIVGAGAGQTQLVWDDYALKKDAEGREYVTFRTYTLAVCAEDVTVKKLAIRNTAYQPETKGQEVALSVCAGGFSMEDCLLSSTQDTLFVGPLPPDLISRYDGFLMDELRRGGEMEQRFVNCQIEGTVDFIFGCGSALFQGCEIRSLKDARDIGYVAAPAHTREQLQGLTFRDCRFTCEEAVTPGSVYLARPWRDYGLARFENCAYGPHIAPAGFDKWNDTHRDQTARFYETPEIPGRVAWINRDERD